MGSSEIGEVMNAVNQRTGPEAIQKRAQTAALLAVKRLETVLKDPETSGADVIKAATLIFDRVYTGKNDAPAAGDFEILVKEE